MESSWSKVSLKQYRDFIKDKHDASRCGKSRQDFITNGSFSQWTIKLQTHIQYLIINYDDYNQDQIIFLNDSVWKKDIFACWFNLQDI